MSQLFNALSQDFQLPEAVDPKGAVVKRAAGSLPAVYWPDGRWCFEINAFLLQLTERRLSLNNGGGTLKTYAANLSPLIRFVFANRVRFEDLSDSQFTLFVHGLQAEQRERDPGVARRNANTVIEIGRLSLEFLAWLGSWVGDDGLVGKDGRIRAEKREVVVRGGSHTRTILRWHHRSLPTPDPRKKRRPITTIAMERLGSIVATVSSSMYLRRRRYVMLKLLEITGGRRSEVNALKVEDVKAAKAMANPMLKLRCAKRPGGKEDYRSVPVSRQDVVSLMDFIKKSRGPLIGRTCGEALDDGYVLVNERTGKGLRPNTIAQELSMLRLAAGITEQASAHMFRHRFATKLFVALAEHHQARSKDDFRHMLFGSEKLKAEVSEWLGHLGASAVDGYIDFAFEEISGFKEVVDMALARATLDSFGTTLLHLRGELVAGASPIPIVDRLLELMTALGDDLAVHRPPSRSA